MNDEVVNFLVNYDYSEIEKIPDHIAEISTTQKLILEELQKEPEESETVLSEEETPAETTEEIPEEIEVMSIEAVDQDEYMKLIYEELQVQNELLQDLSDDSNQMLQEGFLMVVIALVIAIGTKIFIEQITKW